METLFSENKLGELEERIDTLISNYRGIKVEKEKLAARMDSLEAENRELKQRMTEMQREKELILGKVKSILDKMEKMEG